MHDPSERARPRPPLCPVLLGLLLGLLLAALPLAAQIEEEDLSGSELEAAPLAAAELDPTALRELLASARAALDSTDPTAAEPILAQVIDRVEPRLAELGPNDPARRLLARAIGERARLRFDLFGREAAAGDLDRLLEVQPTFSFDRDLVSPKLLELWDVLRGESFGFLQLAIEPADAEVRVGGIVVDPAAGPIAVAAGPQELSVTRAGYTPHVQPLEIEPGRTLPLDFALDRVSPVLRLTTRPPGAEVLVGGELVGRTEPPRPGLEDPAAPPGFSAELELDGLELGLQMLEVRREGFRTFRREIDIAEAIDYRMPPIALEETSSTLVLEDLPRGAEIRLDGSAVRPDADGSPVPRMALRPGEYDLLVLDGRTRVFRASVRLADRQTVTVKIRPRPGLVLLGVLGRDAEAVGGLRHSLERNLESSERWFFLDQEGESRPLLARAGLELETMRALAEGSGTGIAGTAGSRFDWRDLQEILGRGVPGMVYLLAVLSDDLVAREADYWLWSAPPGPARPERLRRAADGAGVEALRRRLDSGLAIRRPWLGALVVDSDPSEPPLVAAITPEGPADLAGLRPGDRIVAAGGRNLERRADLEAIVTAAEAGESLALAVRRGGQARQITVELGSSFRHLDRRDPELVGPLAFADLELRAERAGPEDGWLLRLDQALLLMRAGQWPEAARMLGRIRAPQSSHGLGQAAVDYWLGVALLAAGPEGRGSAVEAFRRAAAVPGSRLEHHDGPYLAPRARARLQGLGVD